MNTKRISHISNKIARRALKVSNDWASGHWHNYPLGSEPKATKDQYKKLWEEELQNAYPEIDGFEKHCGFAVDYEWFQDLGLHTQIVIKDSPLCYQHGRVLYSALRRYLDKSKARQVNIFETGTARGFSAVVMAKALEDAKRAGKITTFDVLPHNTKMYWNCIDDLEGPKTRGELLKPWQDLVNDYLVFIEGDSRIMKKRVALGRVGFAFLDGAHTYDDVMDEFSHVAGLQEKGDVIVFDDYDTNVFPGLVRAVDEGCESWGYDKEVMRANDQRAYVVATKK